MSQNEWEIISTALHALLLLLLIVLRRNIKATLKAEIRQLCEWILSDEFELARAQVIEARKSGQDQSTRNTLTDA